MFPIAGVCVSSFTVSHPTSVGQIITLRQRLQNTTMFVKFSLSASVVLHPTLVGCNSPYSSLIVCHPTLVGQFFILRQRLSCPAMFPIARVCASSFTVCHPTGVGQIIINPAIAESTLQPVPINLHVIILVYH